MTTLTVDRHEIEVSNPDKVFFPDAGVTKGDLVEYYRKVAEWMLPHLEDRPLVMHRFPDGIGGTDFIQKDVPDYFPDWIDRADLKKADGTVTHVIASDAATLVYLANQAVLTPHVWLSRVDRSNHPDQLIFDLDPGDDPGTVSQAAGWLREMLDELGLVPYAKSSGSRGIHVHVPLDRSADFDEVRAFARDLAGLLEEQHPEELTTAARKRDRGGRLFLDTMRNAYAQHAVAPYGVRDRERAPVAVPLDWDEATASSFDPQRVTVRNVFRRLSQKDDPWDGMARRARSLGEPRARLDGLLSDA